eukprot:GDKK01048022.1.p1 GENE.GDKK01048022.1~~GDKK01048022.1.p1  ORF type:complete len:384 (+),score=60.53 GDKK01048022.1:829-1980(+)
MGGMGTGGLTREMSGNPMNLGNTASYLNSLFADRARTVRKDLMEGKSNLFHNLKVLEQDEDFACELLADQPDLRDEFIACSLELKRRRQEQADRALLSFLKVIAEIKRAPDLAAYAAHPSINKRYKAIANDKAINDITKVVPADEKFQISMAFGLHVGWSIEGAIGSEYKIDASYLSLHVNTASRLQSACRKYNCRILLSESLYDCLSTTGRNLCRHIDDVKLKGMETKISIFCVDVWENKIQLQSNNQALGIDPLTGIAPASHQIAHPIPMDSSYTVETLAARGTEAVLQLDADVHLMTGEFQKATDFKLKWAEAMQHYLVTRDFDKCEKACDAAITLHPFYNEFSHIDGPAMSLKEYVAELKAMDMKNGEQWEGYREMTSK